mgnify:CR=1 FL=1
MIFKFQASSQRLPPLRMLQFGIERQQNKSDLGLGLGDAGWVWAMGAMFTNYDGPGEDNAVARARKRAHSDLEIAGISHLGLKQKVSAPNDLAALFLL